MAAPEPAQEIQPANHYARIALVVVAVAFILVAAIGAPYLERLNEWIGDEPDKALERVDTMIAWLAVLSIPLLFVSVFTCRSGLRALASERFPPRGMWVVVDTPVVTGRTARFRGRMMFFAGLLMGIIAVGFPVALWYVIHSVAESAQ